MLQLQALAARDDQRRLGASRSRSPRRVAVSSTARSARSPTPRRAAPDDSRVQLAIGRVLSRARRAHAAIATRSRARSDVLERALGGTAPRSEGLALYGRALYLSGDLAGAERILRDAVATSPVDLEAFGFWPMPPSAWRTTLVARDALVESRRAPGRHRDGRRPRGPRAPDRRLVA